MKIAFLTPEYPHPETGNSGGIGTSIKNLAKGLIQEGCQVRVLVYGQKQDALFDDGGVLIQQIKNVKLKGLCWYFTRKKIEKIINQLYFEKEIDLVEAPDWTGITSFIKPKRCPVIIRLNGSDTYFCHLDKRPVKWINKFHEKRALQKADDLLSVSQFTADITNSVFGLNKKFEIIPNPIDIGTFEVDKTLESIPNTVLYFGSLIRKKGLLELPFIFNELIAINPSAKLVLVGRDVPDIISGSSSTWEMMQQLFSEKAFSNVSYLGSVPYQEIKKYISGSTVCVFPSFAEAFPVSWLEAMAMGKPIVASNIGWANEMIDDNVNGFLVNPKDHIVFAEKINDVLKNEMMSLKMGKAAREKIKKDYDIKVVAKQNIEFFNKFKRKNPWKEYEIE